MSMHSFRNYINTMRLAATSATKSHTFIIKMEYMLKNFYEIFGTPKGEIKWH